MIQNEPVTCMFCNSRVFKVDIIEGEYWFSCQGCGETLVIRKELYYERNTKIGIGKIG